jgi:hypothetical protein
MPIVRMVDEGFRKLCPQYGLRPGFPERKVIQVDISGIPDDTPELICPTSGSGENGASVSAIIKNSEYQTMAPSWSIIYVASNNYPRLRKF